VELADEKQASDIVMLDIRQVSTIADYFVICSAETERQIRAIVEGIDEGIKKQSGLDPRVEGTPDTGWVVLDYSDVVVHVFSEAQREFYRLERLWSKAAPVVVLQ
jgi:ribosome-associated protein